MENPGETAGRIQAGSETQKFQQKRRRAVKTSRQEIYNAFSRGTHSRSRNLEAEQEAETSTPRKCCYRCSRTAEKKRCKRMNENE